MTKFLVITVTTHIVLLSAKQQLILMYVLLGVLHENYFRDNIFRNKGVQKFHPCYWEEESEFCQSSLPLKLIQIWFNSIHKYILSTCIFAACVYINKQWYKLEQCLFLFFLYSISWSHFWAIICLHDTLSRCHLVIVIVMIEIQTASKPYS